MKGEIITRPAVTDDAGYIRYSLWNLAHDRRSSPHRNDRSVAQLEGVIEDPDATRKLFVAEIAGLGHSALVGVADISLTPTFVWSPRPKILIEGVSTDELYRDHRVGERLLGGIYNYADSIQGAGVVMDAALTNDPSLKVLLGGAKAIPNDIQDFQNQT